MRHNRIAVGVCSVYVKQHDLRRCDDCEYWFRQSQRALGDCLCPFTATTELHRSSAGYSCRWHQRQGEDAQGLTLR